MRTIVPGARDLISPRGQFTITLTDERGRVKMRQVTENLVMNQLQEAISTQMRGQQNINTGIGFDATGAQTNLIDTDNARAVIGQNYARNYCQHRQMLRGVYLSTNAATPAVNEWFPVGLIGGANSEAPYSGTNSRRGTLHLPLSQRRANGVRYVWDFGLDRCNGELINSAGLGGITYPSPDGHNLCWGWTTSNLGVVNGSDGYYPGQTTIRSSQPVSATQFWTFSETGLFKMDLSLSTAWTTSASAAVRAIVGPTGTTLGVGTAALAGQSGIAIIGGFLWLMDTLRLRKMDLPTSTTMPTVHNTYSPVTGFTDPTCLGLCTDGVMLYAMGATKVFVIDPATGAVTSSWAHNLQNQSGGVQEGRGIEWDPIHDVLWLIGRSPVYDTAAVTGAGAYQDVQVTAGSTIPTIPQPWSKTGTALGPGIRPNWNGNSNSHVNDLLLMDDCRYIFEIGCDGGLIYGSNTTNGGLVGTRALLGTPFTKTNLEAMRVQYDIAFSVPP